MFKGSFIKLLLGAAILVISYAFPFFLIPIGSYESSKIDVEYSFNWNGEYEQDIEILDTKGYYKIDDKGVYVSITEDVPVTNLNKMATIKNIYTLEIAGETFKNNWALGFTIIGFVLTAWGIIGFMIPKKRK